jgi:hypothetical protein
VSREEASRITWSDTERPVQRLRGRVVYISRGGVFAFVRPHGTNARETDVFIPRGELARSRVQFGDEISFSVAPSRSGGARAEARDIEKVSP